jgi:ribonuclease HI
MSCIIWYLYVDGASKGNPGVSGAGIYITSSEKSYSFSFYLGSKTNNQAEYLALILGLIKLKRIMNPCDKVIIRSDSQLMVRQIQGLYKVKNNDLKQLYQKVISELSGLDYTLEHVLRSYNTRADALANKAVKDKDCSNVQLDTLLESVLS